VQLCRSGWNQADPGPAIENRYYMIYKQILCSCGLNLLFLTALAEKNKQTNKQQ